MSLSKFTAIGRLTRDPEVKQVPINGEQTTVATFSIAVDEDFGDGVDFYDVAAWRKLGDNVGKFLTKGREVYVEGRLKIREYTKEIGGETVKFRAHEIRADKVQFLGGGQAQGQGQQAATTHTGPAPF